MREFFSGRVVAEVIYVYNSVIFMLVIVVSVFYVLIYFILTRVFICRWRLRGRVLSVLSLYSWYKEGMGFEVWEINVC